MLSEMYKGPPKKTFWRFSRASCSLVYFLMVSSSNPPVLTQYPRLRKCGPATRSFPGNCRWIRTALFSLISPLANATLRFVGTLTHLWMRFRIRYPSTISIPRCPHISRIPSPTGFRSSPYGFLFQYFGIITTCYLQCHRTWDKLCHSYIGPSSSSFHGTLPEEGPILFLSGTGEPIRVLHHRWKV